MAGHCRRYRSEEGAFIVLWALLLVALFTMVAIVIDLGALRNDRRKDRAAADSAATAAANDIPMGSSAACRTALDFAALNLGKDSASFSTVETPCGSWSACDPSATSRSVTYTGAGYKITITNPVPNGDPLLTGAEAVGGHIPQSGTIGTDGLQCERVGVAIGFTRESIFGRVVGNSSNSTTVHSVARYVKSTDPGGDKPALVALEPVRCPVIDAKNALIHAYAVGTQPGLIYADSTGTDSSCNTEKVFTYQGNPQPGIQADNSAAGELGVLGYVSADSRAFKGGLLNNTNFQGSKVRLLQPITRSVPDKVYHCGNVAPLPAGCVVGSGGNDHMANVATQYASGSPAGFNNFSGSVNCTNPPASFAAGNWFIDCPDFNLQNRTVTFGAGIIVFNGDITLNSNGVLNIGSVSADSLVVVRGTTGLVTGSNTWVMNWQRSAVIMVNGTCGTTLVSCGTVQIRNGTSVNWTSPESGPFKDLIYWSETTQPVAFEGGPNFNWRGIFFAGNAPFTFDGSSTIEARNVQMWVRTMTALSGSAVLELQPDPSRSLTTTREGTSLIR